MKKLLLCTAALTMFAGSAIDLNGISNVKADNTDSAQTTTSININRNAIQTNPANPFDSNNFLNNPSNHNIARGSGSGALRLDAVPANLGFEDINYSGDKISSTLKEPDSLSNDNVPLYFTQVSDNREDEESGWTLTAQSSDMTSTNSNNSTNKLDGYNIQLDHRGTPKAVLNNPSQNAPSNVNPTILSANQNTPVMGAGTNQGKYSWMDELSTVTLTAPKTSHSGNYTGTITWTLNDTPYNNGTSGLKNVSPSGSSQQSGNSGNSQNKIN